MRPLTREGWQRVPPPSPPPGSGRRATRPIPKGWPPNAPDRPTHGDVEDGWPRNQQQDQRRDQELAQSLGHLDLLQHSSDCRPQLLQALQLVDCQALGANGDPGSILLGRLDRLADRPIVDDVAVVNIASV